MFAVRSFILSGAPPNQRLSRIPLTHRPCFAHASRRYHDHFYAKQSPDQDCNPPPSDASAAGVDEAHVEYECLGKPRPGVTYNNCGTLHGDGTFEPLKNLVAVKLRSDCMSVLVGVAMIPPPF